MNKQVYSKTAKLTKENQDFDLLHLYIRALEKSFSKVNKPENWKIDAKTDEKHVYLTISCDSEENLVLRKEEER